MKAYQRTMREMAAPEPDEDIKRDFAKNCTNATVGEIDYATAKPWVVRYEWLQSMGSARWCFAIHFGEFIGGICCFGTTAGTRVAESVAGIENAHRVCTLVRGCCLPWTPKNSASHLIAEACKQMSANYGKQLFVAYGTEEAGEYGQIYSSLNWIYTGFTQSSQQFLLNGKLHDSRQVSGLARDRRGHREGEPMKYRRSRAEQKQLLLEQGALFVPGFAKHRYIGVYGLPGTVKRLRNAIKLPSLPYPRREPGLAE